METNTLTIAQNKRFVDALEYLAKNDQRRIPYETIIEEIGWDAASFNKLKKGQRNLPEKYLPIATRILGKYGISAMWFEKGTGNMLKPEDSVSEESAINKMLLYEIQQKDKMISKLMKELNRLRLQFGT